MVYTGRTGPPGRHRDTPLDTLTYLCPIITKEKGFGPLRRLFFTLALPPPEW